jgi:fatty-acyl-CoA synthase
LWQCWAANAARDPDGHAIIHRVAGSPPSSWTWSTLLSHARRYATILRRRGLVPGKVCAIILRHRREFYPLYMAVEAVGAIPAVLAYPNARLHPEKFRAGLAGMAHRSGLDLLLTERDLEALVLPLVSQAGATITGVAYPLEWGDEVAQSPEIVADGPVDPDSSCLLQHSSGTTGLQKAVMLSHRAVLEHVNRYGRSLGLNASDRICSWLPLYHDMGLIATFHLALAAKVPVSFIDPFEWIVAPVLMFEAIAEDRSTLAWLPNFSYHLMADKIHDDDLAGLRADTVRMLINCSEPIRAEAHERFSERFSRIGIAAGRLASCYAMAETTFAVTQTAPGHGSRVLEVERDSLAQGRVVMAQHGSPSRRCVSSGKPIDGCEIGICAEEGVRLPDGFLGEIAVRSVSLFAGYRNNPEQTAKVLRDGWYHSGDLGFIHDGELYVIGRKKDLIIVAGKNIYPEDIEDVVGRVAGVLPGRVVAVGVEDLVVGTEAIHIIAETAATEAAHLEAIRSAIIRETMAADVTVSRVHLVPPRWLIKSSAGKPARAANKERILARKAGAETNA